MNKELQKFGYDPIPKQKDYYTHTQDLGNILQQIGVVFREDRLPAYLNGLTPDFKPGKQFFQFAQPRLGGEFKESAISSFEGYLDPASRQLFHTDTIQRGRKFQNFLTEYIKANEKDLPAGHLTNFAGWLNDYVNTLAGKKLMIDRAPEGMFGRKAFGALNIGKQQVGSNMIG